MNNSSLIPTSVGNSSSLARIQSANHDTKITRTSSLMAPTLRMDGHSAEIFSVKFSPSGDFLATASMDRTIFIWNVYGDCKNLSKLCGHQNAVLDIKWTMDEGYLVSASADRNVILWDTKTMSLVRKFGGHTRVVSQVQVTRNNLIFSGSDDGRVLMWDPRSKRPVDELQSMAPVCSLAVAPGGDFAFIGAVDNSIHAWDIRAKQPIFHLEGHHDTVNGLALSSDGFSLVSVSVDGIARVWDVKAFSALSDRCLSVLEGLVPDTSRTTHTQPSWSHCGRLAACGSLGDASVVIWDIQNAAVKYKLPGHRAGVTSVDFHPKEPIIVSGGIDSTVFIGELND